MSVQRLDVVEVPEWISSKFDTTAEGFLAGRVACTNIGIFTYRLGDGTVVRELRLPEEVFHPDSMDSLKLRPVTLDHPMEAVNADNIKELAVGTTGSNVINGDNIYLSTDMVITEPLAIDAVKNGKHYLSCGYSCDMEMAKGRWLGVEYDAIQRNIRYNHLAIVDAPRAGETARIKIDHLDALDAVMVEKLDAREDNMAEKVDELTQKLDELTKANEALTASKVDLQAKLDAAAAEKTALEVERDTLKDKADALEAKVKELEATKLDESVVTARVNARVALLDQAKEVEAEVKADMGDLDIKKAVVMKIFPKAIFEGKSDAYVEARYDAALEYSAEQKDAATREMNTETDPVTKKDGVVDVDKARQAYIDRLTKREKK